MSCLGQTDRNALLLRFFKGKDLKTVGAALSISEDAARMRVNRALESLRGLLRQRGVVVSTALLGTVIGSEAVGAVPAGLAASITGTVLASATASGGAAASVLKVPFMTRHLNIQLPKANWAFSGYGTPEAALQTVMWARREGDFNSLKASLTPSFVEQAQKAWGDKFEEEMKSEFAGNLDRISDCRIVKKEMVSDSEAKLVYVLMETPQAFGDNGEVRGKSMASGVTAKRVGQEWKLEP